MDIVVVLGSVLVELFLAKLIIPVSYLKVVLALLQVPVGLCFVLTLTKVPVICYFSLKSSVLNLAQPLSITLRCKSSLSLFQFRCCL